MKTVFRREFILDCTGCHQFDDKTARVDGRPRSEAEWMEAAWLVKHLGPGSIRTPTLTAGSRAEITEFLMPEAKDLAHDIAVERGAPAPHPRIGPGGSNPLRDPGGAGWPGMGLRAPGQSNLCPHTGYREVRSLSASAPPQRPRRLDVDAEGIVWIPAYAANLLLRFDPRSRQFTQIPLPVPDAVPYIIRVDHASGDLWIGTGAADALLRYHPASQQFESYRLPSRGAMIRHLAIDSRRRVVWAAYGASPGDPRTDRASATALTTP